MKKKGKPTVATTALPIGHKYRPLGLRPRHKLIDLLRGLAKENRRTITAELELAIEAHLAKSGRWPPKDEGNPSS